MLEILILAIFVILNFKILCRVGHKYCDSSNHENDLRKEYSITLKWIIFKKKPVHDKGNKFINDHGKKLNRHFRKERYKKCDKIF